MGSHPCVSCGRFAFPRAGTTCYWCKGGEAAPSKPPEDVARATSRPTMEELRRSTTPPTKGAR